MLAADRGWRWSVTSERRLAGGVVETRTVGDTGHYGIESRRSDGYSIDLYAGRHTTADIARSAFVRGDSIFYSSFTFVR